MRNLRCSWRRAVAVLLFAVASPFLLVGGMALFTPLPGELREPSAPSIRVMTEGGQLLREVRADDGARARPLPLASFPKHVRDAVLAAEDRRFFSHPGVDVGAVLRAATTNVLRRRIVSGASTLTMQLARTLRPHPRTLWGKVTEMSLAVRIEASLSKNQILEAYLNRVSYGPNVRGYAAASQAYCAVEPASLSIAEAALIAGLPRGPSIYAHNPSLARRRRDRVLGRMAAFGMLDAAALARALAEPPGAQLEKPAFGAPHLVRGLLDGTLAPLQPTLAAALGDRRGVSEVHTTIDRELQRSAEAAVTMTLATLSDKHVTAAAVVVLDNATCDVLAYVGSPDFWSTAALGQNDGASARRQPGSALKPFVYAEAMATLGYTGATLLPDIELHIPLPGGGDYVPHDYDTKLRGPVRLREALGNSLNVPAVYTIHQLGTQRVLERLHRFGFASLTEDAEHYGPALALGDGEVTLLELANAYATLARGGVGRPLRFVKRIVRDGTPQAFEPGAETRALEPHVAAMLTDILRDKGARRSAFGDQNVLEFGFDVAAKTGTSKGYRDNVAVGYTAAVTVAVWVGNFDGAPMDGVSGISGAGPIFRAVMEAAMQKRPHVSLAAAGVGLARAPICAVSGEIATDACPHRILEPLPEGDADHAPTCSVHVRLRIDRRNGLRAGPDCPRAVTEERVFEQWRAPFEGWAARAERPTAPEESSPECPIADEPAADSPRIAYPLDGARFVLDPERPTALQLLTVRIEPEARPVELRVDGVSMGKNREWVLRPGSHTITATIDGHTAPPVHFEVR